jgi:hypothetical protein
MAPPPLPAAAAAAAAFFSEYQTESLGGGGSAGEGRRRDHAGTAPASRQPGGVGSSAAGTGWRPTRVRGVFIFLDQIFTDAT